VTSPEVAGAGVTGARTAEATGAGTPCDASVEPTVTVRRASSGPPGLVVAHPASSTPAAATIDQRFRHTLQTLAAIDAARWPRTAGSPLRIAICSCPGVAGEELTAEPTGELSR
jgi:hypothetical protein